jgi:hypothetical protein
MREAKGVGERNERAERRRLQQGNGQHRPKPIQCEVKERGACGHNGENSKFCSKGLETIRYTPGNGAAYQSHYGSRTEHEPEFLGPEPASRKKGEANPNALKSAQ